MGIKDAVRLIWDALKVWWEIWLGLWLFGLVWVLCWITIVLGPPATFGFFQAVRRLMTEKEIHWDEFVRGARTNFLASWGWFLVNLVVVYAVYANTVFYSTLPNNTGQFLQVLALVLGFFWLAIQGYALAYFVLLERKSLWLAWKNALFTFLAAPLFGLTLTMLQVLLAFLHLFIAPVFLAGPGLMVLLASLAVEERIQKFGIREREASDQTD